VKLARVASLLFLIPALFSASHAARAETIYTIDFTIDSTQGTPTFSAGTLFGLPTDHIFLQGSATIRHLNIPNGDLFTAFDLQVGTKDYDLSDISYISGSQLVLNHDRTVKMFDVTFADGNLFETDGLAQFLDDDGSQFFGGFTCLNCVTLTSVAFTPLPSTLLLLSTALGGLGFVGWRVRAGAA
jgi:hypothetical protein